MQAIFPVVVCQRLARRDPAVRADGVTAQSTLFRFGGQS